MSIVEVQLNSKGKSVEYFSEINNLKKDDYVIVDTESGIRFGLVVKVNEDKNNLYKNKNLGKIISLATEKDIKQNEKNEKDSKLALEKCRELVEKYKLNMYIIDATYTHDRSQLFFRFMADNRVDFRVLAKDLANIYKTRIELRQIGVRDRAKEIGGYGQCGKPLCCSKFMNDFDSISINMAKTQNIALNPSKINGICGRLLCCLKYENECYKECSKGLPQMNKKIKTPQGEGKVVSLDVLKGIYKVNIPDVGIVEFTREDNESN